MTFKLAKIVQLFCPIYCISMYPFIGKLGFTETYVSIKKYRVTFAQYYMKFYTQCDFYSTK